MSPARVAFSRAWSPGIAEYGNSIGIPDGRRRDRVRAVSMLATRWSTCSASASRRHPTSSRASRPGVGNAVYYVGAKTGRDGIHGATMASAEFDEKSAEKRPGGAGRRSVHGEAAARSVPRGDADRRAASAFRTWAPAGLTCSTTEMGSRGGAGVIDRRRTRAAARERHDAT